MIRFFKSLYFTSKSYLFVGIIIAVFLIGNFFGFFFYIGQLLLLGYMISVAIEAYVLYSVKHDFHIVRSMEDKLSNGDENPIDIDIYSHHSREVSIEIIDEIPYQFNKRDFSIKDVIRPNELKSYEYHVRPTKRGEYKFGNIVIFTNWKLGLIKRKSIHAEEKECAVYPSFIQLRKYSLLAISDRLTEFGVKKIRKIGSTMEFEQIKNYVPGDNPRNINWKATAKKNQLMINQYQDERSQHVYSIIDMGRNMEMPFKGMTLLDYAINSSLVISNVANIKHDKSGLITFSNDIHSLLKAERKKSQITKIQEHLYNIKAAFEEPDFSKLYVAISRSLSQRSLLLLYTNFESLNNMKRQLPVLKSISRKHLLIVIFFDNVELREKLSKENKDIKGIYRKVAIENLLKEKENIKKAFESNGIKFLFTTPEKLTIDSINKYLEVKSRRLI